MFLFFRKDVAQNNSIEFSSNILELAIADSFSEIMDASSSTPDSEPAPIHASCKVSGEVESAGDSVVSLQVRQEVQKMRVLYMCVYTARPYLLIQNYASLMTSGLEGFERLLRVADMPDLKSELNKEDNDEYECLKRDVPQVIRRVHGFTETTGEWMKIIEARINGHADATLRSCFEGFSVPDTDKVASQLSTDVWDLLSRIANFQKRITSKYWGSPKIISFRFGLSFTIGALFETGLAILHFAPFVAVTLPPIGIVATIVLAGTCVAGAGAAALAYAFSESDIDKAAKILKHAEENLREIKNSLTTVSTCTKLLTGLRKRECTEIIRKIITACEKVVEACRKI